ncbi:uncharacterized protein VTP21DRAFT_8510 [Calcarisporiella thermophila]|uniref:uncharacterized protein n=1 Tax=Calcarisporiella thermophila TaxID=911321 RepID=UPI0037425D47
MSIPNSRPSHSRRRSERSKSTKYREIHSITGRVQYLPVDDEAGGGGGFYGQCQPVHRYEKLNQIGEGTYGVVYRARDRQTNEIVALKRIRMQNDNDGMPVSSIREISLLQKLKHPNVVSVLDIAVGKELDQVFMVMEYCEQDLSTLMDTVEKPFQPSEIKCLVRQLLEGLKFIHENYVIHRDLKMSNLLLNSRGILKIADFGLARVYDNKPRPMTPRVVTLWYRPPELLLGEENYTTAVDMWSVGCIFAEFLQGKPVLPGKTEQQQLELIVNLLGAPNEKIWPGMHKLPLAKSISFPNSKDNNLLIRFPNATSETIKFLNALLCYDPKRRLKVWEALKHGYFSEYPRAKEAALLPTYPEIRNKQDHIQRKKEEYRKRAREADKNAALNQGLKRRVV